MIMISYTINMGKSSVTDFYVKWPKEIYHHKRVDLYLVLQSINSNTSKEEVYSVLEIEVSNDFRRKFR